MNPQDPSTPTAPNQGGTPVAPAPAEPSAFARFLASVRRWLIWAVVIAILAFAVYVFVALRFSYSEGERAGLVQKFSKQGWVCKTWEGELAIVTVPGSLPEKFIFTVRDDTVAQSINASMGKQVSLRYELHPPVPSCFGETNFHVTGVREIQ